MKLIKRQEWLKQEQVAQRQIRLAAMAKVNVDPISNWVKRHRAAPPPNARQTFAALFVQPPAK